MLTRRIFRPVPFRSVKDIVNEHRSLYDIIRSQLNSDYIFIQDSSDMIVEKFSISELRSLEYNNGILYSNFSFHTDNYGITIFEEYLGVCGEYETAYFLNDTLSVICCSDDDFDEDDTISSCYLRLTFNNKLFEFKLVACNSNSCYKISVFINDVYVCKVNNDNLFNGLVSNFELVQICKTDKGFDLILYFDEINHYVGFSLSYDLGLISVINLSSLVDFDSKDTKGYRGIIAKSKLLYG